MIPYVDSKIHFIPKAKFQVIWPISLEITHQNILTSNVKFVLKLQIASPDGFHFFKNTSKTTIPNRVTLCFHLFQTIKNRLEVNYLLVTTENF